MLSYDFPTFCRLAFQYPAVGGAGILMCALHVMDETAEQPGLTLPGVGPAFLTPMNVLTKKNRTKKTTNERIRSAANSR